MRAIGYVRRREIEDDSDAPVPPNVQHWDASVGAVAGSWGQIREIESRLRLEISDPVQQIIEYCRLGGHHLTGILGIVDDDQLLQGVEAELSAELGSAFKQQIPEEFGDPQFAELMERIEGLPRPASVGGHTRCIAFGGRFGNIGRAASLHPTIWIRRDLHRHRVARSVAER